MALSRRKDKVKLDDIRQAFFIDESQGSLTIIRNRQPSKEACPNIAPLTYRTFYTEFVKALSGEGQVPVKPEDARDVIRLIELARKSSQEGKTLDV